MYGKLIPELIKSQFRVKEYKNLTTGNYQLLVAVRREKHKGEILEFLNNKFEEVYTSADSNETRTLIEVFSNDYNKLARVISTITRLDENPTEFDVRWVVNNPGDFVVSLAGYLL